MSSQLSVVGGRLLGVKHQVSRNITDYLLCHTRRASRVAPHISRLVTLTMFLFLLVATPALTQSTVSPSEAMLIANQRYEAGQFAEAVDAYETIIEAGWYNSDLYYNLGNAYFKQGDLGRAILNYRRAQHLAPRDPDVAANLRIARVQTLDRLEASQEGLANLVQLAEQWLTLNEAALLALVLWLLICALAILAIFLPRLRRFLRWSMAILALFLIIGLISIANRIYTEKWYPPAVIVAQEVDVTSGPGGSNQYLVEFSLHAGAEVRLLERRVGWRRITLPGDLQGWVPVGAVGLVVDEGRP